MNILTIVGLIVSCIFFHGNAYAFVGSDFRLFLSDRLAGYDDKNNWLVESEFPSYYKSSNFSYRKQFVFSALYDSGRDVRSFFTLSRFESLNKFPACWATLEMTNYSFKNGHMGEILFSKKFNVVTHAFGSKFVCQVEGNEKFSFDDLIFVDGTLPKRELENILSAPSSMVSSSCDKYLVNKKENFQLFKIASSYDLGGPDYYLFYKANSVGSKIIKISANLNKNLKLSVLHCDYTWH